MEKGYPPQIDYVRFLDLDTEVSHNEVAPGTLRHILNLVPTGPPQSPRYRIPEPADELLSLNSNEEVTGGAWYSHPIDGTRLVLVTKTGSAAVIYAFDPDDAYSRTTLYNYSSVVPVEAFCYQVGRYMAVTGVDSDAKPIPVVLLNGYASASTLQWPDLPQVGVTPTEIAEGAADGLMAGIYGVRFAYALRDGTIGPATRPYLLPFSGSSVESRWKLVFSIDVEATLTGVWEDEIAGVAVLMGRNNNVLTEVTVGSEQVMRIQPASPVSMFNVPYYHVGTLNNLAEDSTWTWKDAADNIINYPLYEETQMGHMAISGAIGASYNRRLMIGDVSTLLPDPSITANIRNVTADEGPPIPVGDNTPPTVTYGLTAPLESDPATDVYILIEDPDDDPLQTIDYDWRDRDGGPRTYDGNSLAAFRIEYDDGAGNWVQNTDGTYDRARIRLVGAYNPTEDDIFLYIDIRVSDNRGGTTTTRRYCIIKAGEDYGFPSPTYGPYPPQYTPSWAASTFTSQFESQAPMFDPLGMYGNDPIYSSPTEYIRVGSSGLADTSSLASALADVGTAGNPDVILIESGAYGFSYTLITEASKDIVIAGIDPFNPPVLDQNIKNDTQLEAVNGALYFLDNNFLLANIHFKHCATIWKECTNALASSYGRGILLNCIFDDCRSTLFHAPGARDGTHRNPGFCAMIGCTVFNVHNVGARPSLNPDGPHQGGSHTFYIECVDELVENIIFAHNCVFWTSGYAFGQYRASSFTAANVAAGTEGLRAVKVLNNFGWEAKGGISIQYANADFEAKNNTFVKERFGDDDLREIMCELAEAEPGEADPKYTPIGEWIAFSYSTRLNLEQNVIWIGTTELAGERMTYAWTDSNDLPLDKGSVLNNHHFGEAATQYWSEDQNQPTGSGITWFLLGASNPEAQPAAGTFVQIYGANGGTLREVSAYSTIQEAAHRSASKSYVDALQDALQAVVGNQNGAGVVAPFGSLPHREDLGF